MGYTKDKRPELNYGTRNAPVKTETTTANLLNVGVSIVKSTATLRKFALNAPTLGVIKTIFCTQATTSLLAKVNLTGGASIFPNVGSGSTIKSVKFNHPNQSITLQGLSSVRWGVLGTNNSPVLSTSSG